MTSNKAQKTAARQRMAQTGEPYSVARRAVSAGDPGPEAAPRPPAAGTEPSELSPEEQYAQEGRAAGVPAAEIDAQLARFRDQEATEDRELEAAGLAEEAWDHHGEPAEPGEPWDHHGEPAEPGEPWDHHGEPAEPAEPWDFDDEPWEPGEPHPRDWHPEDRRMTMHRPPHPPPPPRPPRPPRPARPPRPW